MANLKKYILMAFIWDCWNKDIYSLNPKPQLRGGILYKAVPLVAYGTPHWELSDEQSSPMNANMSCVLLTDKTIVNHHPQ